MQDEIHFLCKINSSDKMKSSNSKIRDVVFKIQLVILYLFSRNRNKASNTSN